MELTNNLSKIEDVDLKTVLYSHLLIALYPFAPHLCSEWFEAIWQVSIHDYRLKMSYNEVQKLVQSKVPFLIQLNGKFICSIDLCRSNIGKPDQVLKLV